MFYNIYITYIVLLVFQPGIFWKDLSPYRLVLVFAIANIFLFILYLLQQRKVKLNDSIGKCLFIFVIIRFISNIRVWLIYSWNSIYESTTVLLIYFITVCYIDKISKAKTMILAFILPGIFIGSYGIYDYYQWKIHFPDSILRTGAYGMYANANDLTHLMILIFPFVFKEFESRKNIILKSILLISMGVIFYSSYLAVSRGGLLGLSIVVTLSVISSKSIKKGKKTILIFVILSLAMVFIIPRMLQRAEYQDHRSLTDISDRSIQGRRDVWWAARQVIKQHPILGIGDNQFSEYFPRDAHNVYYVVATEKGLPGFFVFLLMIFYCFKALLKARSLKDARKSSEEYHILMLAQATGISLIGFLWHGLFANKEKELVFYMCIALCSVVSRLVDKALEKRKEVEA